MICKRESTGKKPRMTRRITSMSSKIGMELTFLQRNLVNLQRNVLT